MTPSSIPLADAELSLAEHRQHLQANMHACRTSTLSLVTGLTEGEFRQQAHTDFSPLGWHLGHIAFTESLWLLEHLQRSPCPYPHYQTLFAADGLPKAERENLPDLPTILAFMADIRDRVFDYLATAPLERQLRLWRWLLQHESQHAEIATYLLAMHRQSPAAPSTPDVFDSSPLPPWKAMATDGMVFVPGGNLRLGRQAVEALDNEQPLYAVSVDDFWIDQTPVTVGQYAEFIAAGGYHNSQWWQPTGWRWRQRHGVTQPRYWPAHVATATLPVCGVSWYEADAYACFVGKRLPTEAEWERAARWEPHSQTMQLYPWGHATLSDRHGNFGGREGGVTPVGQYPAGRSATGCDDLLGNVWEWTDTWFDSYPGFAAFPYPGYSQAYFDRAHRVLRGGSWATRPWILRPTFRNWYHPHVQQVFAGFRCVLGT